jgi:hypothetical protein
MQQAKLTLARVGGQNTLLLGLHICRRCANRFALVGRQRLRALYA